MRKKKLWAWPVPSYWAVAALLALVSFFATSACTTIPEQKFKSYTDAFAQVEAATEQLFLDLEAAEKKVARIKQARNPPPASNPPYPRSINLLASASASDDLLAKRRRALEAVARFNDLLLALAAGKTSAEVKGSVDSLITGLKNVAGLVGANLPIPAPVGGLIATAVDLLQKAQNRQQFIAAVRAAAPVIDAALKLFAQDAENLYRITAGFTDLSTEREIDKIVDFYIQMRTVAETHKPPTGDFKIGKENLKRKLEAVLRHTGLKEAEGYKAALPSNASGKEFDAMVLSQLEQTFGQMEAAARNYTGLIEKQRACYGLVLAYGHLLNQTRQTLQEVRLSIDRPADIRAQALELIGFAFEVKRNWEAVRDARLTAAGG